MYYQMERAKRWVLRSPGGMALGLLLSGMLTGMNDARAASSLNLTFKYTVMQGTCTLDVPANLPMSDVTDTGKAVGKNWIYLNKKSLTVTLSNCDGIASPTTRPAIKLVTPPVATTGSADRKTKIFTSSSNKTGLGVVLSDGTLMDGNAGNLVTLSGLDAFVNLGGLNTVATNQTKQLNVALACGTAADCSGANLVAGAGDVSIQFAFVYH